MQTRTHVAALGFLVFTGLSFAQTDSPKASAEAIRYLETALDQIEKASRVYSTDWQALRTKARASIDAVGAATAADTYPAIRDALVTLGDKHGRLLEPAAAKLLSTKRPAKSTGLSVVPRDAIVAQVLPGSPAAEAGLAIGDRIVAVEGVPGFADLAHLEFGRLFRRQLPLLTRRVEFFRARMHVFLHQPNEHKLG